MFYSEKLVKIVICKIEPLCFIVRNGSHCNLKKREVVFIVRIGHTVICKIEQLYFILKNWSHCNKLIRAVAFIVGNWSHCNL